MVLVEVVLDISKHSELFPHRYVSWSKPDLPYSMESPPGA